LKAVSEKMTEKLLKSRKNYQTGQNIESFK